MTRRSPSSVVDSYSTLPVRQSPASTSSPAAFYDFANPAAMGPATASDVARNSHSTASTMSKASQCFLLADMDGRSVRDNRACTTCIAQLRPHEVSQINWHLDNDDDCRLCQVAATKPEAFTKPFCDFLTENPTVFHTVDYCKTKLHSAGYQELPSRESWAGKIHAGGKYYVSRNGSSIIAFAVGRGYKTGQAPGFAMVGGHIDALTARLKPVSTKPNKAGFLQLGVAPYAGALNETWWDRDLAIGGRVIVRDPKTGKTSSRLVRLDWPIAKIPTLAPHFGVGMMGQKNKETQAVPVVGLESTGDNAQTERLGPEGAFVNTQPPKLVKLISKELGVKSYTDIVNWELELYDAQPAQTIGLDRDMISAGRIDDKLCSWGALMGLLATDDDEDDTYVKMTALFDDEEIGSKLRQGAGGSFLPSVVERTVEALNPDTYGPGLQGQVYAKSFLLSADVSHAGNPNFLGEYLPDHTPQLNVGIVVAGDSNGHMTTDAVSTAILSRVAELVDHRLQPFQIRNDSRSGGTIGPMLSSFMGCKAADAGMPQLSMHSVRATTGSLDPGLGVQFFKGFLDHWETVDGEWEH
ncbi:Peptidase M18 [Akanthomyces lecanii RCEF 1005]|uniref:Peptidase M18 n=1 Tax=Akanthomyces lecanii RCEF 1005 TaxID=1081108 RepID=A0A168FX09_CORDF|nr:Peptidase M18 [Akanthomyces lecanii RCEF 1005]